MKQTNSSFDEKCFACGKAFKSSTYIHVVDTRDDQLVYVGPECFKKVKEAGEQGYESPKGGPKLYLTSISNYRQLCSKCGAILQPLYLKNGICYGCRNPHLKVTALVKEKK